MSIELPPAGLPAGLQLHPQRAERREEDEGQALRAQPRRGGGAEAAAEGAAAQVRVLPEKVPRRREAGPARQAGARGGHLRLPALRPHRQGRTAACCCCSFLWLFSSETTFCLLFIWGILLVS